MRDVKDLNKKSDQEAKRLKIYLAAAYGVTFLMGLLMWFGNSRHYDLSAFPNAQMYYPAAGVMLGVLYTYLAKRRPIAKDPSEILSSKPYQYLSSDSILDMPTP